jgi:hypothetical protein
MDDSAPPMQNYYENHDRLMNELAASEQANIPAMESRHESRPASRSSVGDAENMDTTEQNESVDPKSVDTDGDTLQIVTDTGAPKSVMEPTSASASPVKRQSHSRERTPKKKRELLLFTFLTCDEHELANSFSFSFREKVQIGH